MCQLQFRGMTLYTDNSSHVSHSCSKTTKSYLYILFIGLKRLVFKLSFDTIHAFISFVIVKKTVFEVGRETHMSAILLSSETIWLRVIQVFLAAHATLYKSGCMRLRKKTESTDILSALKK